MRLLRKLAVLLGNVLDRVRRALLSWAGVVVSTETHGAETHDTESVNDRPGVWLEYVRARAPGLVAGKWHLPSQTVPTVEPSWPARSARAPVEGATLIASPPTSVRATATPRLTAPRVQPMEPRPQPMTVIRPVQAPGPSVPPGPARPIQPSSTVAANRSSQPIAMTRPTAAQTSGSSTLVTHTHAPTPSSVRLSLEAAPQAPARPPQHSLPETASLGVAPPAEPKSAERKWLAVDAGPASEPVAGKQARVPERPTSGRSAPRSMVQTDLSEDERKWADLPDTGLGEWEVQSTRSLIREQLHLARLLKEQAGSSWSALHS